MAECFFCSEIGGIQLWSNQLFRIILVEDKFYPGYLRVVLNHHVKELTDLSDADNFAIYRGVCISEKIVRQIFNPAKINLASFGNLTPHVHWHIIPRFSEDRHFPNPTWGEVTHPRYRPALELVHLNQRLITSFSTLFTAQLSS